MNKIPKLTVELDDEQDTKLNLFCKTRKKTKVAVIREAIDMYMVIENARTRVYIDNKSVLNDKPVTATSFAEMCDIQLSLTTSDGKLIKNLKG